jgi:hypothetical protein
MMSAALRSSVLPLADAHEVLVSSTKDLVAGSGLRFADRGNLSLKGVTASGISTL